MGWIPVTVPRRATSEVPTSLSVPTVVDVGRSPKLPLGPHLRDKHLSRLVVVLVRIGVIGDDPSGEGRGSIGVGFVGVRVKVASRSLVVEEEALARGKLYFS